MTTDIAQHGRGLIIAGGTALVLACTACASTPASLPTSESASAERPETPQAVECPVTIDGRTSVVELRIPLGFAPDEPNPGVDQCLWTDGRSSISVAAVDPDAHVPELRESYEHQRSTLGQKGDEEIEDLHFDTGVEVFPDRIGDRLSSWSYSDGSPHDGVAAQADGVDLSVSADDSESSGAPHVRPETRALFDAVAATVRIDESATDVAPV